MCEYFNDKMKKDDFNHLTFFLQGSGKIFISLLGNIFFKVISKKGLFFLLYYVIFAVQSESEIRFLRSNLEIRFFQLNIL